MNNYSEFQVNIFSNNRDIRKCQSFCTMADNDDAADEAAARAADSAVFEENVKILS